MTLRIHYAKRRSGTIRSSQLRGKMWAVLYNVQKRAYIKLQQYVATWNVKPHFETEKGIHYAGGDLRVNITTDDQVFWWLEEGTSVRYRVMSSNPLYEPKTATGQINSKTGAGYPDYFDPMGRPGIEPRHIGPTIAAEEAEQFRKDVWTVVADVDFLGEDILG